MDHQMIRILISVICLLGFAFYPQIAYACTLGNGVGIYLIPWTPIVESDCTVTGYAMNWRGVLSVAVISVVTFGIWRYVKRNKKE
jgi:hypothetical protein